MSWKKNENREGGESRFFTRGIVSIVVVMMGAIFVVIPTRTTSAEEIRTTAVASAQSGQKIRVGEKLIPLNRIITYQVQTNQETGANTIKKMAFINGEPLPATFLISMPNRTEPNESDSMGKKTVTTRVSIQIEGKEFPVEIVDEDDHVNLVTQEDITSSLSERDPQKEIVIHLEVIDVEGDEDPDAKTVAEYREDLQKVKEELKKYKEEHQVAPDDEDFFQIIFKPEYQFTQSDQIKLWIEDFIPLQNPSVTKEELNDIYEKKRTSIHDFLTSFQVGRFGEYGSKCKFAFKGDRQFYYEEEESRANEQSHHTILSINKNDMRHVWISPDLNAFIQPCENEDPYNLVRAYNGLLNESLIYSPADQAKNGFTELKQMPNFQILEKKLERDGRQYLVLTDMFCRYLLDPECGYAIVEIEYFSFDFSYVLGETTGATKRNLGREKRFLDLKDVGAGIWLPSRIETVVNQPDGEIVTSSSTYDDTRINSGLEDSFFEDVIPAGAQVHDNIHNLHFVWESESEYEKLVHQKEKAHGPNKYRSLSMVIGLAFLVIIAMGVYRRIRVSKM